MWWGKFAKIAYKGVQYYRMGFIEDLRKKKAESGALASVGNARRAREIDEKLKAKLDMGHQRWLRRKMAKDLLSSSAFPRLAKDLQDLVPAYPKIEIISGEQFEIMRSDNFRGASLDLWPIMGEDSARMGIILSNKFLGTRSNGGIPYSIEKMRLLVIESDPDGNLTVHAKSTRRLPLNEWNGNYEAQENALEEAYLHPMERTYKLRISSSFHPN